MNTLFTQARVGPYPVSHRVVMAPLTRMRTDAYNVPGDLMVEYYAQRASPGGLMISDATSVSALGFAYVGAPGIYTEAHHAAGNASPTPSTRKVDASSCNCGM